MADYCYLKNVGDVELQTCLVMRLYPYKVYFACVTPHKRGYSPLVHRIVQFLHDTGLTRFAYRCDRESAINAMLQSAILESARKGVRVKSDLVDDLEEPLDIAEDDDEPDIPEDVPKPPASQSPIVAVPELTHPGESQTNGLAERAVQAIEDQARTLLVALEARIKVPIPSNHAVLTWVVEHAAYLLNRFQLGPDGFTPFGRRHGKNPETASVNWVNASSGSSRGKCEPSWTKNGDTASS